MTAVNWRRILAFVGLTFAINWAAVGLLVLIGVPFTGLAAMIVGGGYMIVPAAVAIVLARRWGIALSDYGLRLPRNWYIALAALIPLLLMPLTVIFSTAAGLGEFDASGMAMSERLEAAGEHEHAREFRDRAEQMPLSLLLMVLVGAPLAGFTINGLFALGEELGWRGLLQQELAPLGFLRASVLIGVIWGIWHAPMILLGHNFPDHPRLGVLVMTIGCMPLGVIMSWLALKAGTVLAAAVAHGTFNAASAFTLMAVRGGESIEVFVLGYAGIAAMTLVAAVLLSVRPTSAGYEAASS